MQDRANELRAQASGSDGEADVLAKIAEMPDEDKALATNFHQLVRAVAPNLVPRTWYGMPAYATPGRDGKVVCIFQGAAKMRARYNTIGFSDTASMDERSMWPTSFAPLRWNAVNAERLRTLVKRAVA